MPFTVIVVHSTVVLTLLTALQQYSVLSLGLALYMRILPLVKTMKSEVLIPGCIVSNL